MRAKMGEQASIGKIGEQASVDKVGEQRSIDKIGEQGHSFTSWPGLTRPSTPQRSGRHATEHAWTGQMAGSGPAMTWKRGAATHAFCARATFARHEAGGIVRRDARHPNAWGPAPATTCGAWRLRRRKAERPTNPPSRSAMLAGSSTATEFTLTRSIAESISLGLIACAAPANIRPRSVDAATMGEVVTFTNVGGRRGIGSQAGAAQRYRYRIGRVTGPLRNPEAHRIALANSEAAEHLADCALVRIARLNERGLSAIGRWRGKPGTAAARDSGSAGEGPPASGRRIGEAAALTGCLERRVRHRDSHGLERAAAGPVPARRQAPCPAFDGSLRFLPTDFQESFCPKPSGRMVANPHRRPWRGDRSMLTR